MLEWGRGLGGSSCAPLGRREMEWCDPRAFALRRPWAGFFGPFGPFGPLGPLGRWAFGLLGRWDWGEAGTEDNAGTAC
jgi:hypothetical protein